jgi:hypothetical protein
VWLTEGEKDADTAVSLGKIATTNAQGAHSFPTQLLTEFHGLHVGIIVDHDLAGYQRAITLHEQLRSRAAEVVVLLPAVPAMIGSKAGCTAVMRQGKGKNSWAAT